MNLPPIEEIAIPAFLVATPESIRAWDKPHPMRNAKQTEETKRYSETDEKARAAIAEERRLMKRLRDENHIAKMLARKEDTTGKRWNPNLSHWEVQHTKEEDMDVSIAPRTFVNPHTAARAARRALGKSDAQRGVDFEVEPQGGGYTMVMKPTKIASGPTGIQRQYTRSGTPLAATTKEKMAVVQDAIKKSQKPVTKKPAQAKKVRIAKAPTKRIKDGPNKNQIVADLLRQKDGTTTAEILKATGWPSVTVPGQAKAAGLKLRKEKVKGEPTRYYAE